MAIAALRPALSAIDNASAVGPTRAWPPRIGIGAGEAERKVLSHEEVLRIVRAEIADRTLTATAYERLGRDLEAARLRAEAEVLAAQLG